MASGGGGGSAPPVPQAVRYAFTFQDSLDTTHNGDIPLLPGQDDIVSKATAQVRVAPAGADINVDILLIKRVDGSVTATLGTITIPDSLLTADLSFAPTLVDSSHALVISIGQVGSISAGATLTVVIT